MISYEEILKANESIKATDIKGKNYAEVNQRIKAFRMLFPNGQITTEILSIENGVCIIKATASDNEGFVLGTGTAYEKEGSSFINNTSYIENCETSAVGRALAMCGIGIDVSVASKEEVENAKLNQNMDELATEPQKKAIRSFCTKHKINLEQLWKLNNCTEDTLTNRQATDLLLQFANKYGD